MTPDQITHFAEALVHRARVGMILARMRLQALSDPEAAMLLPLLSAAAAAVERPKLSPLELLAAMHPLLELLAADDRARNRGV